MGTAYAKWYASRGAAGKKPDDPEMLRAMDLFREAFGMSEENRVKNAKEIWKIAVEQMWSIGTVGQSPAVMGVRIVKNNMGNVPDRTGNAQHARTPHSSIPITYYFKKEKGTTSFPRNPESCGVGTNYNASPLSLGR